MHDGKRVLARATTNSLAGRVVARGPLVAHPWCSAFPLILWLYV